MTEGSRLKARNEKLKARINSLEHLVFNSEHKVLLYNSYLSRKHRSELQAAIPNLPSWVGGRFWMRER